jgi:hypothetical protein
MRLVSRTLSSLALSSIAITLTILVTASLGSGSWHTSRGDLQFVALLLVTVVGYSALGLLLLMPLALLLVRRRVSLAIAIASLNIAGASLGLLMLSWVPRTWIGAIAGAATVTLWVIFNRQLFQPATQV